MFYSPPCMVIDGKKIAERILASLALQPTPKKFVAVFCVAPNEATKKFLAQKKAVAERLHIDFRVYEFPIGITHDALREKIGAMGKHTRCGGIVLQLPLPEKINWRYVANAIPPEKDIDVLGRRAREAKYIFPPAVEVFETIISNFKFQISNSTIAIVGLGALVGRPIAEYVEGRAKKLFLIDKGDDFNPPTGGLRDADVVVCGAGDPGIIKSGMLKPDTLVIDFGYGTKNGKIMGDFDASSIADFEGSISYTPTPGGTGPILVSKLFSNLFKALEVQSKKDKKSA